MTQSLDLRGKKPSTLNMWTTEWI